MRCCVLIASVLVPLGCPGKPSPPVTPNAGLQAPVGLTRSPASPAQEDRCATTPEAEGCLDEDVDGDGLTNARDGCVNAAEDIDGFEDEDGCPDPDNDGDGVLDENDHRRIGDLEIDCRTLPEDPDGFEDEDGCPDVLEITGCQILKRAKIVFAFNKWVIETESFPVLDEVVATLNALPSIAIRIDVHSDSKGTNRYGMKPTQRRADSLREYLVEHGIDRARIESIGWGEDKPIDTNKTAEGRAHNRRVEFWLKGCNPPP